MIKTKFVSLVFVIFFCMAAYISAQEPLKKGEQKMEIVDLDQFIGEVQKRKISFVIAYDEAGADPVLIAPGPGNEEIKVISGPVKMEDIQNPLFSERLVEIKTTAVFSAYGSPGCQLVKLPNGIYVWVRYRQ